MSLTAGTRLGPYEILGAIGAGGMGDVYMARDTRLDRTVAIKVLPPGFAEPEHRARFEREARAVAALSHPYICTLHDVGEQDGSLYLVMEHVEGHTLAERIRQGPLPLAEALEIGAQIADALSVAHHAGIVHRDLKPANVMVTKSGIKLLDFGLAKLGAGPARPVIAPEVSAATRAGPLTRQGTILGTLHYMAPEQLEGEEADARADIWALGLVLYEMTTGRRAFERQTQASLIGAILENQPAPVSALQPLVSPGLERVILRCLAKRPDDRWDSARDVAAQLRWIAEGGAPEGAVPRRSRWRTVAAGAALVAAGAGATAAALLWSRQPPTQPGVVRSIIEVAPAGELHGGGALGWLPTPGGSRTSLAWTPDGRALLFVGRRDGVQQLYLRELRSGVATAVPGTTGAVAPVLSPDGAWVAFWSEGAIRKVQLSGGPPVVVWTGQVAPHLGLAWTSSGTIVFGKQILQGMWQVSSGGGTPTPFTTLQGEEVSHSLPHALPGVDAVLYTARRHFWAWGGEEIVAQRVATGERKSLLRHAVDARYVPSGHLVFLRLGTLLAVPFDLARLEVRGSPVPLLDGVAHALTATNSQNVTGAGQFSVSRNGTLAYVDGPLVPYPDMQLVSFDRGGKVTPLLAPVRSYMPRVRVSPDGSQAAVGVRTVNESSLWLVDLARRTLSKVTATVEAGLALWTPDGTRLAFEGNRQLFWQKPDASAPPERLFDMRANADMTGSFAPAGWSPDGRELLLLGMGEVWVMSRDGPNATVRPLPLTPANKQAAEFSPDGRALAFASNASGRLEVYVESYPQPGSRRQVSVDGGTSVAWNRRGGELFFVSLPDAAGVSRMMVASVSNAAGLVVGLPRVMFAFDNSELPLSCSPTRCYDVASDGQRFFAMRPVDGNLPPPATKGPSRVTHIQLVQNWFEELKAKVPVR